MASQWFDIDRMSTLEYDDDGIPDNHTITVNDRHVSIDAPTLIQNNVKTETITLSLDDEWNDMLVTVLLGSGHNCVELQWLGTPLTIPASVMKNTGGIDVSVVGLNDDGTVRLVTAAATDAFNVVASGLVHGSTPVDDPEDLTAQLLAAAESATEAATAANDAASSASTAASSASSAASAANTAATAANEAAQSANDAAERAESAYDAITTGNVLKRAIGPDAVLTTDDAFSAVPLWMKVYGNTQQNLWTNPSGTSNGMTVTSNEDGTITVSGTSTGNASVVTSPFYLLKPGDVYTLSIDKKTDFDDYGFFVQSYDGSSYTTLGKVVGATKSTAITIPEDSIRCRVGLQVTNITEISGTYRIMLNEGSEAQPWCPPGLNSVESLEIVTAGKNIIDPSKQENSSWYYTYQDDGTINALSADQRPWGYADSNMFMSLPTGSYTLSLQSANATSINNAMIIYDEDSNILVNVVYINFNSGDRVTGTFTLSRRTKVGIFWKLVGEGTVTIQLELGSTATDYEQPNVTTIPIDLQGNELCSLPDGTRDVLDVVTGTIAKSVGYIESYAGEDVGEYYIASALTDSGEIAQGAQVVYKLPEQQEVQLAGVQLPALPSPNLTAYADSDVPCELGMEYIRDVNVVCAKQDARIAALEEAVAANTLDIAAS